MNQPPQISRAYGYYALALLTLPLRAVALSLAGALVLNLVIAINHRRDRYVAM